MLADGAKLAGILLESALLGRRRFALAIGIGVNVVAHPEGVPYPATSLPRAGRRRSTRRRCSWRCRDAWTRQQPRSGTTGTGLARIRQRWLSRAAGLVGEVAVRVDGNVVRGVFETIDEDCRFVIRSDSGDIVTIAAGDVHFGAVASAGAA